MFVKCLVYDNCSTKHKKLCRRDKANSRLAPRWSRILMYYELHSLGMVTGSIFLMPFVNTFSNGILQSKITFNRHLAKQDPQCFLFNRTFPPWLWFLCSFAYLLHVYHMGKYGPGQLEKSINASHSQNIRSLLPCKQMRAPEELRNYRRRHTEGKTTPAHSDCSQ